MKFLDRLFDAAIARRLRKSNAPLGGWQPKKVACWDCNLTHALPQNIRQALVSAEDFLNRHEGHQADWFEQPGLAGLWTPNNDVKQSYVSNTPYVFTSVNSLASSSTLLAGASSLAVSNTSGLYLEYHIGGQLKMGSSTPTVDTMIEVCLYSALNDSNLYSDTLLGTDVAKTLTSAYMKRSAVKLFERIFIDATANQVYSFGSSGIMLMFGGFVPRNHALFVTQNSGQALAASGNQIHYVPIFNTVI